jgi:hypothetical protein
MLMLDIKINFVYEPCRHMKPVRCHSWTTVKRFYGFYLVKLSLYVCACFTDICIKETVLFSRLIALTNYHIMKACQWKFELRQSSYLKETRDKLTIFRFYVNISFDNKNVIQTKKGMILRACEK